MNKLIVCTALASLFTLTGFSQTKKIAHRSHSGKNPTFNVKEEGNFGLPTNYKSGATKDTGAKKTTTTPDTGVKSGNKKGAPPSKKPVSSSGTKK